MKTAPSHAKPCWSTHKCGNNICNTAYDAYNTCTLQLKLNTILFKPYYQPLPFFVACSTITGIQCNNWETSVIQSEIINLMSTTILCICYIADKLLETSNSWDILWVLPIGYVAVISTETYLLLRCACRYNYKGSTTCSTIILYMESERTCTCAYVSCTAF